MSAVGAPRAANLVDRLRGLAPFPTTWVRARELSNYRIPLYDESFPFVVLWSQKAGCTTLTKWFFFQTGLLEAARAYGGWSIHVYQFHVHCKRPGYKKTLRSILREGRLPLIKLVRDPYWRAVSSYLQIIAMTSKKDDNWAKQLVHAARAEAGKPPGPLALSFKDFVRHLAKTGVGRGDVNAHVAQQFVPAERAFNIRLLRLEEFEREIRTVETEFGLRHSPLEELSESRHHRSDKTAQESLVPGQMAEQEITFREMKAGPPLPHLAFYDDEARDQIRRLFAADFKAYGYRP